MSLTPNIFRFQEEYKAQIDATSRTSGTISQNTGQDNLEDGEDEDDDDEVLDMDEYEESGLLDAEDEVSCL